MVDNIATTEKTFVNIRNKCNLYYEFKNVIMLIYEL